MAIPFQGEAIGNFLQGIGTGTDMFSKIMQPITARNQLAQQMQIHKDRLALQKQVQARAQQKFAQEQKDRAMLQQLMERYGSGGGGQGGNEQDMQFATGGSPPQQSFIAPMPQIQQPSMIPSAQAGNQSMIAPIPQVYQPQGQMPEQAGPTTLPVVPKMGGGVDKYDQLRKSPYIRGLTKKYYGIDIGAETPEEKTKRAIEQHKQQRLFDAEHPISSGSGMTSEDRKADRQYKLAMLEERRKNNETRAQNASTDEKIRLAKERELIKTEQQKIRDESKGDQQIRVVDARTESEYKKTLNKDEGKQYSEMERESMQDAKSEPNYKELKDLVSSPILESVRQHPIAGKLEFEAFRRGKGTPEQRELIGRLDLVTNKLIADAAKGLNSRFTNKDLSLAQNMKISPNDNIEAMRAKAEYLIYLHDIGQRRLNRSLELARDRKMRPVDAFRQADKELDGDQIRADIRDSLKSKGAKDYDEKKTINGVTYYKRGGQWEHA